MGRYEKRGAVGATLRMFASKEVAGLGVTCMDSITCPLQGPQVMQTDSSVADHKALEDSKMHPGVHMLCGQLMEQ